MLLLLSLAGCGENKPPQTEPIVPTETEGTKESTVEPSSSAETTEPAPTESSAEETTVPAPSESSAELPTETESAPAERAACTTKLLEGSIDEKTGVTYYLASDGAYRAPNDFAVINEKDIVILDNVSCRLQRFKDGQYFDTVNLPEDLGDYYELCVIGESAYVLANGSLAAIGPDGTAAVYDWLPDGTFRAQEASQAAKTWQDGAKTALQLSAWRWEPLTAE
jgi:hypothetical protein